MTNSIDLNADLGEDDSDSGIARDIAIMNIVTSCNIACGGHAGTPETMQAMLRAAKTKGISAGAHPSYPDRDNFGRTSMIMHPDKLKDSLMEQMEAIEAIAGNVGNRLTHLKPHGALYNDAQDDEILSDVLASIARARNLALVGMGASAVEQSAQKHGVYFIAEAFIDRQYTRHSRLVPRSENGAVIHDESGRIKQGLILAQGKAITTEENHSTIIRAETLCLHSDSDGALATAKEIRRMLEREGINIEPPVR
ncbi:5-oxoprolinase subunit PxpA [Parasphingorhabdus sp.]|uniref:5-oxoprolinase subunit PxpA n=1 Tax=Parasphingorhabdus sp. TaxID=2709688 RepID=UPI002F933CA2